MKSIKGVATMAVLFFGVFVSLLTLSWVEPVWAACSGGGLTWSCAAGSTAGEINSAISGASDTATITLANGSYTFSGVSLAGKNGITIICESEGGCTINSGPPTFTLTSCNANVTNLVRISGFNITGVATSGIKIWVYCAFDITKLRIDHIDFDSIGGSNLAIFVGEGGGTTPYPDRGHVYGVVDHINCHAVTHNFLCLKNTTGGDVWTTGTQGTGNALFFEDNICNFGTRTDFGSGCTDNWRAQSTVMRFNTVIGSVLRGHSMCHNGPQSLEVYGNVIDTSGVASPGGWDVHLQGSGENIVWGNRAGPQGGGLAPLGIQHYRSSQGSLPQGGCTIDADGTVVNPSPGTPAAPFDTNRTPTTSYYGYPAWHQPGRDGNVTLKPIYSWLNRVNGTGALINLEVNTGTWTGLAANCADNDTNRINCHMQKNRDIYQETTSFDGTSGVGVGTLAARPATCTPTPEAADAGNGGVGYWATDQGGNWNTSSSNPQGVQQNGADGALYRCSATNTWILTYTPYTYPHPLQGLGNQNARFKGISSSVRISGGVSLP